MPIGSWRRSGRGFLLVGRRGGLCVSVVLCRGRLCLAGTSILSFSALWLGVRWVVRVSALSAVG